jgi:hypothetical protein
MLKRVRWLAAGAAVGFGGSLWMQRKLKTAASRYRPVGVAGAAASRARDALEEGRAAMKEREAELRGDASRRRAPRP